MTETAKHNATTATAAKKKAEPNRLKLTKAVVDRLPLPTGSKRFILTWDTELKGFGVCTSRNGVKTYFIDYRTRTGRARRMTLGRCNVRTPEDARVLAKARFRDIEEGRDPMQERRDGRNAETLEQLWTLWHEAVADKRQKPKTLYENNRLWQKAIKPTFGARKLADVSDSAVSRWHAQSGATPYVANRALVLLDTLFNYAVAHKFCVDNPCRNVNRFPEKERSRRLGSDELALVGAALTQAEQTHPQWRGALDAVRLLVFTGMRRNEALTLRWADVDTDKGFLHMADSKTGPRIVLLNGAAVELLTAIRKRAENAPPEKASEYVFPSSKNAMHPWVNLMKVWTHVRSLAGLEDVRIHDLRHCFGSTLGDTQPIQTVAALLGHAKTRTSERYVHLLEDPMRKATDAAGAILKDSMEKVTTLPDRKAAG